MNIVVNGKDQTVVDDSTISALLGQMSIEPDRVAVELNRQVIVRSALESTVLNEGDEIEIVQFVGGG